MGKQESKILEIIRGGFSERQGRRVPGRLRELALSGVRQGHTCGEVARAAGVSRQSVVNWSRRSRLTRGGAMPVPVAPVELKVIESQAQAFAGAEGAIIRITLCSGAVVEMPARALKPRWLVALNGRGS